MTGLLIEKIPKTELHLHIEGTLEPDLMFSLAHKNNIELPFKTIEEVKNAYNFHNLQSFLDIYYQGTKVLINEEDFFTLTYSYLEKAAAQNITHTEIFFDPQSHTERGIPFATIINGIDQALKKGRKELNISSYLIMCFLRHLDEDSAIKTLKESLPFQDKIIGIGLDSSELGNPPSKFKNVFKMAKDAGFLTVAHAGEEGPPEYIWEAINILGVARIDHGVRCLEDANLIKYLQETQIPLTVCPLSNVKLRVFKSMKEHNLKTLLDLGLCVTVNSDDPAYFGGYLLENFLAAKEGLKLTDNDLKKLVENGFQASFLPKNQ